MFENGVRAKKIDNEIWISLPDMISDIEKLAADPTFKRVKADADVFVDLLLATLTKYNRYYLTNI